MKNVISRTGQSWKIKMLYLVLVLSVSSAVYGQINSNELSDAAFFCFVAGGAFAGTVSFVFSCASIKCSSCGYKWFWAAVSGKGRQEWLSWLDSLVVCPGCGEPKVG